MPRESGRPPAPVTSSPGSSAPGKTTLLNAIPADRAMRGTAILVLAAVVTLTAMEPVPAHPHVFVEARAVLVFGPGGTIEAVRNEWTFDAAYSGFAVAGLDANRNGALEPSELAPLARLNVGSLADYGYFTDIAVDGVRQAFTPPTDYDLTFDGLHLTLDFALPLARPVAADEAVTLQVFDPGYFVSFLFSGSQSLELSDAPPGCGSTYHPPPGLDTATMSALNALPATQRTPPPALAAVTGNLAGYYTVTCRAASPKPTPLSDARPPAAGTRLESVSGLPE